MKKLVIVGATGSIGMQAIEIAQSMPDEFSVVGLAAHSNKTALLQLAQKIPSASLALVSASGHDASIGFYGTDSVERLIESCQPDLVINAASGASGLLPSLAAIESGADLALANKESIVLGWSLLKRKAEQNGCAIIPVDSEHAALSVLLAKTPSAEVAELIITASGGIFRNRSIKDLETVLPDEAARHPNWKMGRKITIDSASLANKGLEVIEACKLFSQDPGKVKVAIHPQSIVHALVRTRDGQLHALLSKPDMKIPILASMMWPKTPAFDFGRLDMSCLDLEFRAVDFKRYPMLAHAYEAASRGDGAIIAYNAANEVAVEAFERRAIGFMDIPILVARVLEKEWAAPDVEICAILETDKFARSCAQDLLPALARIE